MQASSGVKMGGAGRLHSGNHHEFLSTEHLGTEAIAAFVDGELSPLALRRAKAHLLACPECRREVARQRQASRRLRDSSEIHIPADLRARLADLSNTGAQPKETTPADRGSAKHQTLGDAIEQFIRAVKKGGIG